MRGDKGFARDRKNIIKRSSLPRSRHQYENTSQEDVCDRIEDNVLDVRQKRQMATAEKRSIRQENRNARIAMKKARKLAAVMRQLMRELPKEDSKTQECPKTDHEPVVNAKVSRQEVARQELQKLQSKLETAVEDVNPNHEWEEVRPEPEPQTSEQTVEAPPQSPNSLYRLVDWLWKR